MLSHKLLNELRIKDYSAANLLEWRFRISFNINRIIALSHSNSVFSQRLKLISRHEFEALAKTHHKDRVLRKMLRWSQFVSLSFVQLRRSL
ncbi:MAG: DUF4372 domain-containing protein [Gammaproteobacteria bacterium]|nr:DUF4372 domain-containing protein [Gammaproteobacteria bacterium]